MKEVTKEEFYAFIGPKDAVYTTLTNKYPYDGVFKLRYGTEVIAKTTEDYVEGGRGKTVKKYFIKS